MQQPSVLSILDSISVYGTLRSHQTNEYNNQHTSPVRAVPKSRLRLIADAPMLLTVRQLEALSGLTVGNIYSFIRTEPTFPYVNVGKKKKYLIDKEKFFAWLDKRSATDKSERFNLSSANQLISRFKK